MRCASRSPASGSAMSTEAAPTTVPPGRWRIGLIGYGEVGRILAEELRSRDHGVRAWDLKLGDDASAGAMRQHAAAHGVVLAGSSAEAAADTELVICAVTASQTVAAAEATGPGLAPSAFVLEFNAASPGAKAEAARLGLRYVDCSRADERPAGALADRPHRLRRGRPHPCRGTALS